MSPRQAARAEGQLTLFAGAELTEAEREVLDELRGLSIGRMTPVEAMVALDRLSRRLVEQR